MKKQVKFVLLEIGTQEELRDYYSLEEAFRDLRWKCPSSFWVGVVEEGQAYTITQFYEKFATELEAFNKKENK